MGSIKIYIAICFLFQEECVNKIADQAVGASEDIITGNDEIVKVNVNVHVKTMPLSALYLKYESIIYLCIQRDVSC